MDGRGGTTGIDIFAQHVLATGVVDPDWKTNGAAVCTAPGRQASPKIDTDGAGGAIVTWFDPRDTTTRFDVYAQHVTSSGVMDLAWPADGRAVCTAAGDQFLPSIVTDGAQGAIVSWTDDRDGTPHIFAHHVLASGALDRGWPVQGLPVVVAPIEQQFSIQMSDGAGGTIVSWEDQRSGVHNMYAQHVRGSGTVDPQWPVNGIALSTRPVEQTAGAIVQDGSGGAIVTWEDDGKDIFAQHVLASGALDPALPAGGQPVIAQPNLETNPSMVATGAGGAIIAWTDFRSDSTSDIFALQLLTVETTGVGDPPPTERAVSFASPSPNPARESFLLRFALPSETRVSLDVYDASGRRVRALVARELEPGAHLLTWDGRDETGARQPSGVYFVRAQWNGFGAIRRLVLLR